MRKRALIRSKNTGFVLAVVCALFAFASVEGAELGAGRAVVTQDSLTLESGGAERSADELDTAQAIVSPVRVVQAVRTLHTSVPAPKRAALIPPAVLLLVPFGAMSGPIVTDRPLLYDQPPRGPPAIRA